MLISRHFLDAVKSQAPWLKELVKIAIINVSSPGEFQVANKMWMNQSACALWYVWDLKQAFKNYFSDRLSGNFSLNCSKFGWKGVQLHRGGKWSLMEQWLESCLNLLLVLQLLFPSRAAVFLLFSAVFLSTYFHNFCHLCRCVSILCFLFLSSLWCHTSLAMAIFLWFFSMGKVGVATNLLF